MSQQALLAENKRLKQEVGQLKHELFQLKKLIFGRTSERYVPQSEDVDQLTLFGTTEQFHTDKQSPTEQVTYKRKKKNSNHPGRNPIPDHLPVEQVVIEPDCNTEGMKKIGEVVTDTLDYTPGKLYVKRVIRPKYARENGNGVVIGELPGRVIEKGRVESGLLAHLLVSKFVDHLPFYRQQQMFKRNHSWEVSRSTINDWFASVCVLLEPLYVKLKEKVLDHHYLQVDESTIKVLTNKKPGKTHLGYHWVYHAPETNLVLFDYRQGRGQEGPKEVLSDFKGHLQCDGYGVYDVIGRSQNVNLVGCMAHARRKFFESKQSDEKRSHYALEIFKGIYGHERKIKEENLCPKQIKEYRNTHVKPLMEQILSWIKDEQNQILPKSPIGKAMQYYQSQWPKLKRVLEDGRIQIDNNLIENVIRPLALGRKNYLFAGSHKGAQRAAMMYSFFATCKLLNVNPWEWLKDTLDRLPDYRVNRLHELLPGYKPE